MSDTGAGASAPTGCYECGRPGHWSRDCPSSSAANATLTLTLIPNPPISPILLPLSPRLPAPSPRSQFQAKPLGKPKKLPKTRPKLTPELLLSDNGLGYILCHFPRNFKYRGRGHEVSDLKNLLRMYSEWHSQLLPCYPFDQFIHKVDQVGTAKREALYSRVERKLQIEGIQQHGRTQQLNSKLHSMKKIGRTWRSPLISHHVRRS